MFAALYFSEGAPIGYIWWALPARLRAAGVAVDEITQLTAALTLPWALKFLWAPVVDALRSRRWTHRSWIIAAQLTMAALLLPLPGLDLIGDFHLLRWLLLAHALAAATQDVAIDAWCISLTPPEERGRVNGWMQAGMLLGRSLLGGGALVIGGAIGEQNVVWLLIGAILISLLILLTVKSPPHPELPLGSAADTNVAAESSLLRSIRTVRHALVRMATSRTTWLGLGAALTAGAAFEALGAIQGPLLIDRGWSQASIGLWTAVPLVSAMAIGSLAGGWLSDRWGHRRLAAAAIVWIAALVCGIATVHQSQPTSGHDRLLAGLLFAEAIGVGVLTASLYALLMDLTLPAIAGTQFSAFMAAGNACEVWTAWTIGRLAADFGYSAGLFWMAALSLPGLLFLASLPLRPAPAKP